MGDDIWSHYAVAGIVGFSQCVRVRGNVRPEILHLCPFAIDNLLVVVHECIAIPVRGATQLATRISWRPEAGEKAIALRVRVPTRS
jgi:hypothetical protein